MPDAIIEAIKQLTKRVRALESNERSEVTGSVRGANFADLPAAGQSGRVVFVTNGRKAGEGAGAGSGVLAFDDGSNWIAVDTGTIVAA